MLPFKRLLRFVSAVMLSVFLTFGGLMQAVDAATVTPTRSAPVKIAVISDVHYYDDSLGTSGQAWETEWYSDFKMRAESSAILDSAINSIKNSDAQIVLVSGDLTNDGEKVCHEGLANKLEELKAAGKKVYVIDGNHDINNYDAASYSGSTVTPVANISMNDFKSIYHDFGYDQAVAVDPNSLSYAIDPVPGLRIIMMDSALYANNSPSNPSETGGSLETPDTGSFTRLDWIDQEIDDGIAKGDTVIGVEHHPLTNHFVGNSQFFPDFVLQDANNTAANLASHGMHVVFTGHFHTDDITKVPNQDLFDVETGSMVTYPVPIRYVELTPDNQLKSIVQNVTSINYNPPIGDFMPYNSTYPDFQTYARDTCNMQQQALIPSMLAPILEAPPFSMSVSDAVYMADSTVKQPIPGTNITVGDMISNAMLDNRVGDESPSPQTKAIYQTMINSGNPLYQLLASFCQDMDADLFPADNKIDLDLNTGQAASTLMTDAINYTLPIGATHQTVTTFVYSNGSSADVTFQANYTSSDPAVATVDAASGLVTGIAPGNAVITADYNNTGSVASAVYDPSTGTCPESSTTYAATDGTYQEQIQVTVTSPSGGGGGGASVTTTPTTTPTITAGTVTDTSVILNLSASANVNSFNVYENGSSSPVNSSPITANGNQAQYTVTGLTPNTSYSFTATAIDASGSTSAMSSAVAVTTQATNQTGTQPTTSGQVKFSDVPASFWAYNDISYMVSNGYVHGVSDGKFAPNNAITRAEFIAMLANVLGLQDVGSLPFSDVNPDDWYYTSVAKAYKAGLIHGYAADKFGPTEPINREQMAVLIANALNYKGVNVAVANANDIISKFSDAASLDQWAASSVAAAVKSGVISGKTTANGNVYFAPADQTTRAEATVMLKRMVDTLK